MNYTRMTKTTSDRSEQATPEIVIVLQKSGEYRELTYEARGHYARATPSYSFDGKIRLEAVYTGGSGGEWYRESDISWGRAVERMGNEIANSFFKPTEDGATVVLPGVGKVTKSDLVYAVRAMAIDAEDRLFERRFVNEPPGRPWATARAHYRLTSAGRLGLGFTIGNFEILG
jgi:hypothetical protein